MPSAILYVVDTHVLIWYFIGSPRLPQRLKDEIDHVRRQGGRLLVPTIVLAEARAILTAACLADAEIQPAAALQDWVDALYGEHKPQAVVDDLIAERRRESHAE